MGELKSFEDQMQGMSPEQKAFVNKLIIQNQQLAARLQQNDDQIMLKKLEYLFKVVELQLFGAEFTARCEKEIEFILSVGDKPTVESDSKEE